MQEALLRALATWPTEPPTDPKGWLVTVAWRKFLDATRGDVARQAREVPAEFEPPPGPVAETDDPLRLYFLCAHPSLSPASAVALMLLHFARSAARTTAAGALVPLAEQDRSRWDPAETDGPRAGLAALEQVEPSVPRRTAVEAYLREQAGELEVAARLYADAARAAANSAERDHLTRQAARLHEVMGGNRGMSDAVGRDDR